MNKEEYETHKPFADEKKPSMLRRRVGHDYESRRMYFITMTVEGRRPLLGRLVGRSDAPEGSAEWPHVELSELGKAVQYEWMDVTRYHPEVSAVALQIMPDHLHGILFVREQMEQHLGQIIKGFKASTNKHYRRLVLGVESAATASLHRRPEDKRDRSLDNRQQGFLWSLGYNDHILSGKGELQRWVTYLHENPLRLTIKHEHPDLFRVRFGINVAGQTYAAIGNQFLLKNPQKQQVQCSRSLTEEQIKEKVAFFLAKARQGAILVSPAISKGEQAVMRAALDAHLPLIFLTPWGFNAFSKPGHQYFNACAEGHLLILAPWEHQNQRIPLTREMCMALNGMTKNICER
jgi:REP element-mobilizing transposase RayT